MEFSFLGCKLVFFCKDREKRKYVNISGLVNMKSLNVRHFFVSSFMY
jgi:hypothetical protein